MHAEVAELADALRSGRSEHFAHVGSNPTFGINSPDPGLFFSNRGICVALWLGFQLLE